MHQSIFLRLGLCEEASDIAPGATAGGGVADPKMTLGARLTAAASIIANGEKALSDLNAKVTELSALNGTQATELETARARILVLETEAKEANDAMATIELESKSLKEKETSLEKRASEKSKEQVRALGFSASKLPSATDKIPDDVPTSRAELEEKMAKLPTLQAKHDLLNKFKAANKK